tara:strand:- start:1206 stop:1811 length:606 start_codon:yes stop_codon:yes gene_type:complete
MPSKKPTTTKPTPAAAPSKKSASKNSAPVSEPQVPVPQPEPIIENKVVVEKDTNLNTLDALTHFMQSFQNILSQFNQLKVELKSLEKKTVRELKIAEKSKNKKKKGTRAPSGFVKPAPISDELAGFLGIPVGSEMARTEVTREINKYIREHELQDKSNGRKIIPDNKLSTLLKVGSDVDLTYFNLQRYMGPHFPKQVPITA